MRPMKVVVVGQRAGANRGTGQGRQPIGLRLSAHRRSGQPIRSVLDHAAVMDLAKVNGDQGRLGGLLKLWLVDRPGRGAPEIEVRRLLERIGELQGRLAEVVGRV